MGLCHGKPAQIPETESAEENPHVAAASGAGDGATSPSSAAPAAAAKPGTPKQPKFPFYLPSPLPPSSYKGSSPANSSAASTSARKRPFPPPSPAKHIRALLARRHGSVKPNEASIPEGGEPGSELGLDKSFGFLM